jgi:hypothetical protein
MNQREAAMAAFAKSWWRSRQLKPDTEVEATSILPSLELEDCTLVAWYRAITHLAREGRTPSDGGNCWPHSAARQLLGRLRRARSRRLCQRSDI